MIIQYLGHACFLLTNEAGDTLLMDPFDPTIGAPVPAMPVDGVTISHGHSDHNYTGALPGEFVRIDGPGSHKVGGFSIEGIDSFHDGVNGAQRGSNLLFLIQSEGLRIAHLGDLGHALDARQLQALGKLDVLLLPIGGYYTIDADEAMQIVRRVAPRIAIPMHYQTGANDLPIADEANFARAMGADVLAGDAITVRAEAETGATRVIVLHPAMKRGIEK